MGSRNERAGLTIGGGHAGAGEEAQCSGEQSGQAEEAKARSFVNAALRRVNGPASEL